MFKKILLLFYTVFIFITAFTQVGLHSNVQQFTTDNGLPSNGIKGIQWDDKTGFLWLATEAGIVRFNGVDFRSFTKDNTDGFVSERMLFMGGNYQKKIYISDLSGNVFLINQNKPELWHKALENISPYSGSYYLLPTSQAFFKRHLSITEPNKFSSVIDKTIALSDTSCIIKKLGKLYYNSININEAVEIPVENNEVVQLYKINEQVFFINSFNEIYLLTVLHKKIQKVEILTETGIAFKAKLNTSNFYWEAGMNNPIVIENKQAWLLKFSNNKLIAELIASNIPSDALIRFVQYSDKNKTLFIGTDSKGLIVINKPLVESKKRNNPNSQGRNSYYSQIELTNGNILTNEGDIIGNNSNNNVTSPITTKFSYHVFTTGDSVIWFSEAYNPLGENFLKKYNYKTRVTKTYKKIIGDHLIKQIGTQTYIANPHGIGKIIDDTIQYLHRYPKNSAKTLSFTIEEIKPNILAIATCSGLLTLNLTTNKIDTLLSKPNACVRSIWKYKDYVFLGTYGSGFFIWKNNILKEMPLDKNRYLQYTHCFIPDKEGYCWISTNHGLFKCSIDELIQVYNKNTKSVYYHFFGKKDGMEMTELNGGCNPCALVLKNKTISFPTMDGLLWVNPLTAIPALPEGNIFIDEIIVDNSRKNIQNFTSVALPSFTNEIIIKLAYSAWCNKENIYLEYQLNNGNWKSINSSNESEILLNNLPAGKYNLKIRKLNGFGFNNYTYKEIIFTIQTPWYLQWWFFILCSLFTLGALALFLKFRTQQYRIREQRLQKQVTEKTKELQQQNEVLEKNNTIKTKLISIISHDIVTPLKFVTVAGKNLLEKRKLMTEELQQETIQEITNTSQELQLLSTNILNWIKYQNENRRMVKESFNVYELCNQVFSILNSMAKQKNIQLVNNIQSSLQVHQYYEPLKILIYNLLTNAIHFTESGQIIVSNTVTETENIITVTDTGSGMSKEQIQNIVEDRFIISSANVDNKKGHGLGYMIIKDLIKTMEASIKINSEKGKGTAVSIILPINNN